MSERVPDGCDFDVCAECGEPFVEGLADTCPTCGEDRIEPVSMFLESVYERLLSARKALDAERLLLDRYEDDPGEPHPSWLDEVARDGGLDWTEAVAHWRRDFNERSFKGRNT